MSNTIYPQNQLPVPCDFGPFVGGFCNKEQHVNMEAADGKVTLKNFGVDLNENAKLTLDLSTLVATINPIDYTLTAITAATKGTYTLNGSIFEYTPNTAPSVNRVETLQYTIYDKFGIHETATIQINIIDLTPALTAKNVTLSGTEGQTYTISIPSNATITNTTINYSDPTAVTISVAPTEGTAVVNGSNIIYTPSQTPSTTRTITFKYLIKDVSGLSSEATVSVTLTDITPAVSTTNFTKSVVDNVTLTGSILSNITIKNDTFKSLSFSTPSEGTIAVSGSNYTFTPNVALSNDRTVVVTYTITTTTGLTNTGTMTINITNFNAYANTFWYGNSTVETITQADIEANLTQVIKSGYAGTYSLTSGTGVYKWFVYPKAWGVNPTILDAATMFEIAVNDFQYLTISGVDLVAIRTYYKVNGSINVKFS